MVIEIQGMKFDSVEEMQDSMIFMHRLQGEEVPQDLLDEVAERRKLGRLEYSFHTVRAPKDEFYTMETVKESTYESEDLGYKVGDIVEVVSENSMMFDKGDKLELISMYGDGLPKARKIGEENESFVSVKSIVNSESNPPKFKVGDKVEVVNNSTSGLEEGDVGEIKHVRNRDGEIEYSVKGDRFQASMLHPEKDLELHKESNPKFKVGDTVVSKNHEGLHEVAIVDTNDDFLTYYISPGESWVPVWELDKADDEEVFESLTEAESDPQLGDIVTTTEELNSLTGEEIPPGTPIEVDYSTDTMIAGASGFRVIVIYHRDAEIDNRDKVKVAVRKADRLDI